MQRRGLTAALLLALMGALPETQAGPLREIFGKRGEESREGKASSAEPDDIDALDGKPTPVSRGKAGLPSGTRIERDLAYGTDPAQKLDVYIPPGVSNAPILMMVHGGAWMIGDKAGAVVVDNKLARWVPKGVIVASPNYRMSSSPNPAHQADDVARALAFVQSSAKSWGGNPEKVLIMGHSAGAHLVGLLASDPSIATRQGAKPWLGTVMLDSASMNVVETMSGKHFFYYNRVFGKDRDFWAEVSPYHRLTGKPGPMLMVCSTHRRDDSCGAAKTFAAKANSMGGRAQVLPVDFKHTEVSDFLGKPGAYTSAVEEFMRSVGFS